MTHSRLVTDDSRRREALLRSKHLIHQPMKLYSLFHKDITGRWIRISTQAYSEKLAYRVFGDSVAKDVMGYSIRPIKIESLEAR